MLDFFRSSANTFVTVAKEVAHELNQPEKRNLSGQVFFFGKGKRLVLSGFPEKKYLSEKYREDRSLVPFSNPLELKTELFNAYGFECNLVVWNLSGKKYAYEDFKGQIIEYDFPARAIPPLFVLAEIVNAINTWLNSAEPNVAMVHDISGRRAAIIIACVLELTGDCSPDSGLASVVNEIGHVGSALVPSQIRYFDYFCKLQAKEGFELNKKLLLQRIIVNGVPDYANENGLSISPDEASCRPFLKIFDASGKELDCTDPPESPVFGREQSFTLLPSKTLCLSGDIVLRVFHRFGDNRTDVAMFALSFHVDFVRDVILRFSVNEIDGTAKNPRFCKDMFIDIIFRNSEQVSGVPEQVVGTVLNEQEKTELDRELSADKQKESENEVEYKKELSNDVLLKSTGDPEHDVLEEIEAVLGEEGNENLLEDDDFDLSVDLSELTE